MCFEQRLFRSVPRDFRDPLPVSDQHWCRSKERRPCLCSLLWPSISGWGPFAWICTLCGSGFPSLGSSFSTGQQFRYLSGEVHLEAILLRCFKLDYCPPVIALMLVPCCCLIVEVWPETPRRCGPDFLPISPRCAPR